MDYFFAFKDTDTCEVVTMPCTVSTESYGFKDSAFKMPKGDVIIDIEDCDTEFVKELDSLFKNKAISKTPKYTLKGESVITYNDTSYNKWINQVKKDYSWLGDFEIIKRHNSNRLNKKLNKKYGVKIKYILITELDSINNKTHEISMKIL